MPTISDNPASGPGHPRRTRSGYQPQRDDAQGGTRKFTPFVVVATPSGVCVGDLPDVIFARESLSDALWDEVTPLLQQHYEEIAHWRDIALEPDRAAYARLEGNGGLRIYTARRAAPDASRGRIVGYLCAVVNRSLHYAAHLFASQDVLFVEKAHRGTGTGVELIRFAHDALRAEGVSVLFQHVKHRADINIGRMLERQFGYEHVDDLLAVRLDREA